MQQFEDGFKDYLDKRSQKITNIGDGRVTNIIKEASLQEEYHDMPLFRHAALKLNEYGLEPIYLALAIRIKKIMEENGMDVDQIDSIISEIATYLFINNISLDGLIKSGQEAIMLQIIFKIPLASIPPYRHFVPHCSLNPKNDWAIQLLYLHSIPVELCLPAIKREAEFL